MQYSCARPIIGMTFLTGLSSSHGPTLQLSVVGCLQNESQRMQERGGTGLGSAHTSCVACHVLIPRWSNQV